VGGPQRRVFSNGLDEATQSAETGNRKPWKPETVNCQQVRLTQTQHHTIIRGPAEAKKIFFAF
jgi:hypothetical protein